eukprot:TRINITY_DN2310_c0_g2_i2.p1 TRINITY_DN2310_c0_g2~~TRINITY_DN2310_c0_g2_i2.p1  ORF type:complete len:288 (+),score=74.57 TRINITY_DN2310_c0_g2_i2:56-919(+)
MESKTKILERLVSKRDKSASDLKSIIHFVKNNNLRYPELVLDCSLQLLSKHSSGLDSEYHLIIEELVNAAIESDFLEVAMKGIKSLSRKFGDKNTKVIKIAGTYRESNGDENNANEYYDYILSENKNDLKVQKRKLALLKTKEDLQPYIEGLNKLLKDNMNDIETWAELGFVYLNNLNWSRALYSYEQVIMLNPSQFYAYIRAAEILYTQGTTDNLYQARNYLCYVIIHDPEITRALWTLFSVCRAIDRTGKADAKNATLLTVCKKRLKLCYEKAKTSTLIDNYNLE